MKMTHYTNAPLRIFACLLLAGYAVLPGSSANATETFTLDDVLSGLSSSGSPQLEESRYRAEAASERVTLARSRYFPELGLEGGYESYRWTGERLSSPFRYAYARWNLFNGFRDQLSLRRTREEGKLAAFEANWSERVVKGEITTKFYEAVYFRSLAALKSEALEFNATQQAMAKRKRQAGITSSADETEFSLRQRILESDREAARNEMVRALLELTAVSGANEKLEMKEPSGDLILPPIEEEEALTRDRKPESLASVMQSTMTAEVSNLAPEISIGNWLPRIDVEATYGRSPIDQRQLMGPDQAYFVLRANFPLFNGLSTLASSREAIALRAAASKRLERAYRDASAQIPITALKLKTLRNRLGLEEENLKASQIYYDLTLREYQRGVKNSPDLAGASERIFETRARRMELIKEYLQTLALYRAQI